MTGKYLLVHLGNISEKYYEEAEQDTVKAVPSSHKRVHKLVLIAAIIALTAILVGFTVYTLRLQDMSIGKDTQTQNFNNDGLMIEPTEIEVNVITLYGHGGDPIQQALAEWFAFLETYDPEMKLADNVPDHPEIPNVYEMNYHCYTLDMAAKVDEITQKYGLKLLDESVLLQRWQSDIFFEETGIDSFLLPGSTAQIKNVAGLYYPPYNFGMDFDLSTDILDVQLFCTVEYARKDYFPDAHKMGFDLSAFRQWDYTADDGTQLLLASGEKGNCYIIAEQKEAMLIVHVYGNLSGSNYPAADEILTKAQLEAIADLFDYSIQPQAADMDVVKQRMEEADDAYWNVPAYAPVKYGSFSDYIKNQYTILDEDLLYTFYDITGDGEEDLLIGYDGTFKSTVTMHNGEIDSIGHPWFYLCEGGVLECRSAYEIFEDIYYYTKKEIAYTDDRGFIFYSTDPFMYIKRTRDQWRSSVPGIMDSGRDITEEEVQAFASQYPHIELEWMPFMDYPLSEEQTLREYLEEKDVRVSNEELCNIYREHLLNRKDMHYSHYRIYDINGDGVDDLLLKGEDDSFTGVTDYYWNALTYRYGRVFSFEAADFYLCEDGVLEIVDTRHNLGFGTESNGHQFKRWIGLEDELCELVVYSKATASWMADWWNEQSITDAEAEAILAKYPRIDQGMRPISELLN